MPGFSVVFKDHLGRVIGHENVEADSLLHAVKDVAGGGPGAPAPEFPPNATQVDIVELVP